MDVEEECSVYRSVIVCVAAAYILYYLKWVVKKPTVYCNKSLTEFLESYVPVLSEKFWPILWCVEARCQTIVRNLFGSTKNVSYRRERLVLPDGGLVALDWALELEAKDYGDDDDKPCIVILPGLVGSSKEKYILNLVNECLSQGYRSVVFNYRGNGGVELKTPRTYSAAETRDLDSVVSHIMDKYPKSPLMAVGVSLGGIILTNYLAKTGNECPLKAAMTVSVAWNPLESSRSLEQPINAIIFNRTLTNSLKQAVARHAHQFVGRYDLNHVFKSNTIKDFDERFTCKVFGYKGYEDYYEDASVDKKIHDIRIPLLNLNSEDDPFAPLHSVPYQEAMKSSHVSIVLTKRGGHIGFLEGLLVPRSDGFIERLFGQFSSAIFVHGDKLLAGLKND